MPAQLMAEERGLAVDGPGFEACMQEQRQRSRAAGKAGSGPALKFEAEATAHLQHSGISVTDDRPKCDCPDCTVNCGVSSDRHAELTAMGMQVRGQGGADAGGSHSVQQRLH